MTIRDSLRDPNRFVAVELAGAALILAAGFLGKLPFNATPYLVAYGVLVLWLRRIGMRGVGLARAARWSRPVFVGVGAGIGYQYLSLYGIEPLIARFTGGLPDVSMFRPLIGNTHFLLLSLAVAWVLAAFGEEFVYRGYLMNRIATSAGGGRAAWVLTLIGTSLVFGLGHLYQGIAGVVTTGFSGLVFGILYLTNHRNLWVPILAHGTMDTVGFLLIFLSAYPGL
jgi:membrane protease YdiL (CAAX protease family)